MRKPQRGSKNDSTKKTIASGIALSLLVTSGGSYAAYANSTHDGASPNQEQAQQQKQEPSDQDMVKLLLTGTGDLADQHPEVVKDLGFKDDREKPTPEQSDEFVNLFLEEHPDFHTKVSDPVRSGDPYKVDTALNDISTMAQDTMKNQDVSVDQGGDGDTTYGSVKANTNAVANAEAVVNGAVYANVAAATEAVVAVAAVALAGIVLTYKFDDSANSDMDREHTIADLANELKSI